MVRTPISGAASGDRARKRAGRRARGLEVTDRDGWWYVIGTIRAGGRSIRVRRSLGLPAAAATYDQAWEEVRAVEQDLRAEATGGTTRGDAVAIAAKAYVEKKRQRPLAPSTIRILKEIVAKFGPRLLNLVTAREWKDWVDKRQAENSARTRERFISTVAAFLAYARKHHRLSIVVEFDRDKEARNPRRRLVRHVGDLRPDLIGRIFRNAHITLRAQLAVEWSTGARVSSILYGVAIRDVILAPRRETITFRGTKNGDDVVAALHPSAAQVLRDYVAWRGNLGDRAAPFFLTYLGQPYVDNGRAGGGQNKTGFKAALRRARQELLHESFAAARQARRAGRRGIALETLLVTREDCRLLRRVTQHWFRHMLATRMRHDIRAAMAQGGWRDERSLLGYIHDVPEARRAIVGTFDDFGKTLTQPKSKNAVSA